MTIFSVLKQEHRNAYKLFAELEAARQDGEKTRAEVFALLKQELLSHAKAEHTSLYDRLIDEPATHEAIVKSEAEHEQIERLLGELSDVDTLSANWLPKLAQLKTAVQAHVEKEEKVIFPRAKVILEKNEQVEIAEDFRDRKFYLLGKFA